MTKKFLITKFDCILNVQILKGNYPKYEWNIWQIFALASKMGPIKKVMVLSQPWLNDVINWHDFILWLQFEKQVWNESETICDSQKYLCFGLWWSHDGACLYGRRVQVNNWQKVSSLNFPSYYNLVILLWPFSTHLFLSARILTKQVHFQGSKFHPLPFLPSALV